MVTVVENYRLVGNDCGNDGVHLRGRLDSAR